MELINAYLESSKPIIQASFTEDPTLENFLVESTKLLADSLTWRTEAFIAKDQPLELKYPPAGNRLTQVFRNGLLLMEGFNYQFDAHRNCIVLNEPPCKGDLITVQYPVMTEEKMNQNRRAYGEGLLRNVLGDRRSWSL